MYRAVADFTLAAAGFEAALLPLDEDVQRGDRGAWTRAYLAVRQDQYPNVWHVRTQLPEVADDVFESMLSLVMTGLRAQAPEPCKCHPAQRMTGH
jgi:hypothetical protein